MRIAPALQAQIVNTLAPRVRRRVDALLATPIEIGPTVRLGTATVTIEPAEVIDDGGQIVCDCLLAPACAHRAVVALTLEPAVAEEDALSGDSAQEGAEARAEPGAQAVSASQSPTAVGPADTTSAPEATGPDGAEGLRGAEQKDGATLSPAQRETREAALGHLAQVLQIGAHRVPATLRSALAGDMHRMRVYGLVLADRALTAFASSLGPAPQDAPQERIEALGTLLRNLHELGLADAAGTVTPALLGRARGAYHDVGSLKLTPVAAEPVLTASGFGGVQVTFVDTRGRVWTLSRVRPGGREMVAAQYVAGEPWGQLSAAPRALSRCTLLLTRARARADGRLGGGSRVRMATGASWSGWGHAPPGWSLLHGEITGGDRTSLSVEDTTVALTPAARALGAGLATELFGQALGATVTCLARQAASGPELMGMTAGPPIEVPDDLNGVWWPGLDRVSRDWVGRLPTAPQEPASDPDQWAAPVPSVRQVVRRWLARVCDAGPSVLSSPTLERDARWLQAAGAPFACELLRAMAASSHAGQRRFDGTWQADPRALATAWLALSQY
ncbi:hypothetical protein [Actinomyces oricola]